MTRYHFRYRRHQQPTLIRNRYANAATLQDHFQSNTVIHPIPSALPEFHHLIAGPNKPTWYQSLANEFGWMYQGVGNRIDSTSTIGFIPKMAVAFDNKKVTYPIIVCDMRPNKSETHRTRLTVVGNLLDYSITITTPTATITTAKCLFNSVLYTTNTKCMMSDIENLYLKNLLANLEYIKIHISVIPQEIIN